MSLDRHPSFLYGGPTENPGASAGTMIVETPFAPSSSSVRHATTTKPVIGVPLFVMKALDPSITQSPASDRALVRSAAASDPLPGSVRPNPASISPAAIGGSQRRRCSALPYRAIIPRGQP